MAERIRNSTLLARALKYFARAHIWVYRRTNGRLGAKLLWFPAALLTTTGRKSGPAADHRRRCICGTATKGGAARLVRRAGREPDVVPESAGESRGAGPDSRRAPRAGGPRRDRRRAKGYWPMLIRMYPPYRGYRDAADRVIPLVVCERIRGASARGKMAKWECSKRSCRRGRVRGRRSGTGSRRSVGRGGQHRSHEPRRSPQLGGRGRGQYAAERSGRADDAADRAEGHRRVRRTSCRPRPAN